jgi:cytochrome c
MRPILLATAFLSCSSALAQTPPVPAPDVARGEKRFRAVCGTCHTLDPAKTSIGPHLKGVIGRKAASVPGYAYSSAMKKITWVWDAQRLDPYLAQPAKVVPGTKMLNLVANPRDRADIIAYLATVK